MNAPTTFDVATARRELLARMLSGEGSPAKAAAPEPIPARDPHAVVPLTHEQNQLWLHAEMAPEMPLYNESITIHRLGRYDHAALERALSEVVRRHAIWRTAFEDIDGELVQRVADPAPIGLKIIDISHLPPEARDPEAVRLAAEDARAPIPFDRAPLFRARVVKLGEEEHRLYLTLHHIIFDGVSIYRTLVPELAALVAAYEAGLPSPLPEPRLQYADYAVWQAEQESAHREAQLGYWRQQLAEPLPRLEIAGDRPRPALPTHAGSMEVFELDAALIERLKAIARAEGATLYMVLLAAYKAMLYRYTGDTDMIVGGVTDTRRRPELQPLMGYFLNTFAIRSHPAGARSFRDYLGEVKASVIGAIGNSDVPFDKLIRALDIKRGKGTHPLFNTLFSIEPPVDPFPAGWDLTQMDVVVGAAKYDLYLELDERPEGGMHGRFLYSTELFDVATIRRMIGHWERMLAGVAADPATPIARLPMLGSEERETLVTRWNDTARPLPHASIVDWYAAQAAATPDAIAIEAGATRWRYADLARQSDAVAVRLAAEGIGAGDLVGLSLERTPMMVAAMLGVAKTGAAYLPLDPGFPPARLAMIVESAAPKLVLVEDTTAGVLPVETPKLVLEQATFASPPPFVPSEVEGQVAGLAPNASTSAHSAEACPERLACQPAEGLGTNGLANPAIDGESLAYVLYTSGSTGKPKGVEVPHAALVNLLLAMADQPGFVPGQRLLAITTLSFDIAELELWLPLVSGGTIILASREQAGDMAALNALIEETRPDVMQATPATWRGLIESGWRGLPGLKLLVGGEALPRALVEQLGARVGEIWNVYGPTETTVWSTAARIDPAGPITIGTPIANTQVRILDADGNDRPTGGIGEICIGGRGVATGYRGRPDLTADRFVDHHGTRLYRTGDLGRWRADGRLECLGRTDHEEKIRGFRVAIEEVEGALGKLPGVTAAAVRAWPDASGERALAGYLVGEGDIHQWREMLGSVLPDYMIPTRWVTLDALPLTPNGKVDRKALPEPGAKLHREFAPPADAREERLAAIWRAVLKVEEIARDDDFFDLGGHSLLVARLLRRIEAEYGVRLQMAQLFQAPRLADMAALIESDIDFERPTLIPIQPHGSQPPIVWLDGGSTFLPLAEAMGIDQPFHGLSVDLILDNAGGCPKKMEDVARLVADVLVQLQPAGAFRLGGWCTSGIVAFAVAVRLREIGREVALLMLADPAHPGAARDKGLARLFVSKLKFHIDQSRKQPRGQRWRYFRERLIGLFDAAALANGREAVMQPALRSALDRAASGYTPPRFDGNAALFEPAEHPDIANYAEAWGGAVMGRFDAFVVPGGHRSMLEQPHVAAMAEQLQGALAAAHQ